MNSRFELEAVYENMLAPVGPLVITHEPVISTDEDISEEQEVKLAKQILKQVDQLDMAASEASVKSYRRRLEGIADSIRDLTNQLVQGHPGI